MRSTTDHSSTNRFSSGVPVRATRKAASTLRAARAALVRGFLIRWASSKTATSQSRWHSSSVARSRRS